ncbi:ATP-binding protein [Ornithinimicrobium sp. INDO-MA30-4]|uniref:ATP-binding protein n=1 Tax=Ornithinimicrobium sp. INDO-MA30-4 TaxID=2908651 RepID=UPI0028830F03|nr:ATP-binding protein [Ornithinimicrobium sp. INDO-MA30-4]
MTSDQAPALWPFISTPGLPPTGAQMGIDQLSGSAFHCDPFGWTLRDDVPLTNPNIFSFGKPGTGKSATTKAFCLRMMDFGYRTLILGDPKDEYEALVNYLGEVPITLGPGLQARVNPLTLGPMAHGWENLTREEARTRATIVFSRWLTLIRGLVGSQKIGQARVPFGPTDEVAVKTVLAQLTGYSAGATKIVETTIPAVWNALNNPTPELVRDCRYPSERDFLDGSRTLRDSLSQLVTGTLAGLFDDHTNIGIDWSAPIQSLSLSRLEPLGDEAVGIALMCLNSWGRGMREVSSAKDMWISVRDEAWRQLRLGPEAVKSFDADLRVSRGVGGQSGDIQFAVAHKPSDLLSAGDTGSQAQAIAKDLLHLCDIKILHGQKPAVANELDMLLGLGQMSRDIITGWAPQGKGRALWQVGEQNYKVQTVLHPLNGH